MARSWGLGEGTGGSPPSRGADEGGRAPDSKETPPWSMRGDKAQKPHTEAGRARESRRGSLPQGGQEASREWDIKVEA